MQRSFQHKLNQRLITKARAELRRAEKRIARAESPEHADAIRAAVGKSAAFLFLERMNGRKVEPLHPSAPPAPKKVFGYSVL